MSSGVVIILPKVSSFDSAQLLSFPRRQSLSPSYRAGMWRTLFKSVSRSCSSSSSSFSSPISNLIEFSFCSRTGWILDSRFFCANPRCMCFKHNYSRHSQECISLGERLPGILSSCSFKSYASIAGAVEAISSTDADEETSSVEQIHQHFQVRSDRGNPISTSANILTKMAHIQQHPQKNSLVIGPGKFLMLRKRQIKIETEAWSQATQEYKELLMEMCERKLAPNLPYMKSLFLGWFEPFRDRIATEQKMAKRSKSKNSFASYFNELPADMMAVISMHKLTSMLMTGTGDGSVRVLHAALQIGDAIEQEARIRNFLLNTKKQKRQKDQAEDPVAKEEDRLRKKVLFLMKRQKLPHVRSIVKEKDGTRPWGQEIQAKVGSYLIELLIDTAYIQPPIDQHIDGPPDLRPAFRHSHKSGTLNSKRPMKYGVIQCDPLLQKGLERTGRHMVIPYMPMLIPPVKWTGYDKGGHLFLPSYIMRIHGARKQRHALKSAPRNQLQPIFEALDILGSTKWRINKRVLGIIDRIWSSGGRLADLVDREDVPLPDRPDTEDENAIKAWRWELRNAKKENMERHAHRCSIEIKLAVARKMQDEEGFYYPHNLDFRGRAYPMHANLNHLGSDLCRGVLEFAEGRPLGASGLRWLKIHLANLYGNGVDKKSYSGRLAFTESHLDDIFDSADSPLEGRRWWLTAEDPFQCLAVCINMAEALRSSSPETTISHAPVHQDGSCNGLQHYAALGRDQLGAAAVNLIGGEKPADVYSSIAARVLEIMQIDAEKDSVTYPNAVFAKLLISQVDRKLVKQTVMTSVYGVTFIGARDQIMKRLKERDAIADQKLLFHASNYAAKTVLTALGEMFQAARSIMTWLGDCAKLIAMENQLVRWITPLGLPVVQPYNKIGLKTVKTSLQVLTLHQETDMVMVKRQRTAFPPNFIHSLDGSHMMMTALACRNAGLNFAGVHDSYWTHACDVDELNKLIREKFVELYEQPILENLLESFQKLFPNLSFPELPERGDFDLNNVLDSPYFFN